MKECKNKNGVEGTISTMGRRALALHVADLVGSLTPHIIHLAYHQ